MRTPAELCPDANRDLRDWRFEPLPDGSLHLRALPYGGLQPASLVGGAVFIFLACTVRNRVYPDANVLLIGMFCTFAVMLLWHGGATVEYVAGDNFLEEHRFFLGVRWRKRRLLGAQLEVVPLGGTDDRWHLRAARKGVQVRILVFGASQFQPLAELLSRATGWKLDSPVTEARRAWSSVGGLRLGPPLSPPVGADPESRPTAKTAAVSTPRNRRIRMRRHSGTRRKLPVEQTEQCRQFNEALRDWRFEAQPDNTLRLRPHPYGGLQLPSLGLAVCFAALAACLELLLPNPVYQEARWFLGMLLAGLGVALVLHGASTVDYLAGDNFLEQRRYFCGICWRRRRLLGASLEGVRLTGATDRWRIRAIRKGMEIGSPIYGWPQARLIGDLLARQTGWELNLCEQAENGKVTPYPHPASRPSHRVRVRSLGSVRGEPRKRS